MDKLKSNILTVLKSGITGEKYEVDCEGDIDYILKFANEQSITNLVYEGLKNCGVSNDEDIISLSETVCKNIFISENQIFAYENICEEFQKNGICYMPLKGINMKKLYPRSDLRQMGDLDILIKPEQYEKIKEILLKFGYTEGEESRHEYIWYSDILYIEMHKMLIPDNNDDYFNYFGSGWQLAHKKSDDGTEYAMSPENEYIFLFTHLAKHFRDGGIGIRQFTDLWVFKDKYQLDSSLINKELQKLELSEFSKNAEKTLSVWFYGENSDETTDMITDFVFNAGCFGSYDNRLYAKGLAKSAETGDQKNIRGKLFFSLVFPDFSHMAQKYPVLKKAPVLLPITYIMRWFEGIFIKKGVLKEYKTQLDIQSSENIGEYKELLKKMGIGYNFKN